ncbi:MAG: hypothetical protein SFU86_18200 [Pirellulaceae bacterium]|nr:hypothetical protein [Pirellulaceae bacterium]
MFNRQARVFLSYRHREFAGPNADELNRQHVEWVRQFSAGLRQWGVEVVDDHRVRRLLNPLLNGKAEVAPLTADVALAAMCVCQAFIPVITPGYLARLGYGDYTPQTSCEDGYVLDEFQQACAMAAAGQMDLVPVLRLGNLEAIERLPLGLNRRTMFDLRDGIARDDTVELIADHLRLGWRVEKPAIDMELRDWLGQFLRERLAMEMKKAA